MFTRDFPGGPVVKILPSRMHGVWVRYLLKELRVHMPHGKNQNMQQKQYCGKFNKDFKNGTYKKKSSKIQNVFTNTQDRTNENWRHIKVFSSP